MSLRDSYKSSYYATPLDVVITFQSIVTENINMVDNASDVASPVVQYQYQLMDFIKRATAKVKSFLNPVYGSIPTVTPYSDIPVSNKNNNDPTARLLGISSVGSDAITELWKITFTSTTIFNASAAFSGSQGSGDTATSFESTNGDVTIDPTTDTGIWSGSFQSGDIIWFSTYHIPSIVNEVITELATADAIDSLFYTQIPNENNYARTLRNNAMATLKRLRNPYREDGMSLEGVDLSIDHSPIQVEYDIDVGGMDSTDYADDDTGSYEG